MPAVKRTRVAPAAAARVQVLRPLTITGGLVLSAALALAIVSGNLAIHRPSTATSAVIEPRERYDAAYQSAFRSDGGRSAVTADAVFEFPALHQALAAYPQRGLVQAQILDLLTNAKANEETLAFSVTIASHGADVSDLEVQSHASLVDDRGRVYPVRRWTELATAGEASRAGILTFDRVVEGKTPESADARRLTLTLEGLPGGTRSFVWDLRVLGLVR
jgi:hypothetical protein